MQDVKGFGCSRLRRILDNAADAVSSAFPKGKQQGDYDMVHGHHQMGLLRKKFQRRKSLCQQIVIISQPCCLYNIRVKIVMVGTNVSFQSRNEEFFARSRTIPHLGAWGRPESNQEIARRRTFGTSHKRSRRLVSLRLISTDIAEKGHLWMETS